MENSFQTSFIPKKPVSAQSTTNSAPVGLLTIFFLALLIISSVASAGLFFYKNYLVGQVKVLQSSLAKYGSSFQKETIEELELFDKRTTIAKQILASHIVMSPLFALLGDLTIPSIQYTKYQQQMDGKGFLVELSGVARDYRSIALQADAFNTATGRSFKNVVFSNLTKDTRGNVLFDINFTVDPSLLSYSNSFTANEFTDKVVVPTVEQNVPTELVPESVVLPNINTTTPNQ